VLRFVQGLGASDSVTFDISLAHSVWAAAAAKRALRSAFCSESGVGW